MKYILTYEYSRQIFTKDKFKSFVRKYFENPTYFGSVAGRYDAQLQVDNWEEVKDLLPNYALPYKVEPVQEPECEIGERRQS